MTDRGMHGTVHHCLEFLVLPLHYAATMGLHGVTAWVSTAALLVYVGINARQYAMARRNG